MDQATVSEAANLIDVTPKDGASSTVYRVESESLHQQTYIIEAPSALSILLKPWVVGSRLANSARESTIEFLRVAYRFVPELRAASFQNITEIVPLAGALYYSMAEAFETVFGETINRCFIGARRHLTPSGWKTELSYENFEAISENSIILIGDTIATGGTIESILSTALTQFDDIQAVIIYSIAGGLVGALRIKAVADKFNVPLYSFFSNAIFGLESNGTDMPWLHPGTILSDENREIALAAYGPELGRKWCSIWDWGDRSKHPIKHLEELLHRCDSELKGNISVETREILTKIKNEAQAALDRWKAPLHL